MHAKLKGATETETQSVNRWRHQSRHRTGQVPVGAQTVNCMTNATGQKSSTEKLHSIVRPGISEGTSRDYRADRSQSSGISHQNRTKQSK